MFALFINPWVTRGFPAGSISQPVPDLRVHTLDPKPAKKRVRVGSNPSTRGFGRGLDQASYRRPTRLGGKKDHLGLAREGSYF